MLFNFEGPCERSGGVAQLGERLPCTQEVRSSNLLISTRETKESAKIRANSSAG